ncbi:hypothetical protein BT96DRAFT_116692 [Gymnopus androsaceus JB14]|uniref:Uncharacterized protein n=1 Tax=Gymnopus androsaceus JB14 TaxID=1447944 RepID=A0A6A4HD71_9AGAR|nr:hypothetical protein BT96DRAFT_116692 [Gymnopus androsaceus JB14]
MARVERLGLSEEKALLALSSHALPSEKVQVQSSPPELAPVSKSSLKLDLPAPWYTSDKLASFSGQLFFLTPHHSATMALEAARVRLYEDQLILRTPRPKLSVGKISSPDHLGWRWFQCTKTLQILLPPDVGIRYSVFLKMEKQLLKRASSHTSIQLYNNARNDFITQCLHSKPNYPVRGISPSPHRYALEPGSNARASMIS